jgi:NAD(P)-dependent dehydrogenase (short-subunit alcohol dehydrogenase family)
MAQAQSRTAEEKVALITGASGGIGLAAGLALIRVGYRVFGTSRQAAPDEVRQGIHMLRCDVTDDVSVKQLIKDVVGLAGRIDVLVNNAGVIKVGPLEHMQRSDFEEAMAVHFWGPLQTITAAIPAMRRQSAGRIVNVSSIGGKIGVPHLAPYCASKFALTGLSDSMRGEIAKDGIYVTTVCPGMMRTGSPFNAWFKGRHRDEFAWFAISDSLPIVSIDARRAALQIVDACRHGDPELVITWPAKLAVIANAVMPQGVALVMDLANRMLLPSPTGESGDTARSGWQSLSRRAPSKLTTLMERAAQENNELPQ